jgi:pimeloyl-ACP methyl ester carboxylesterase
LAFRKILGRLFILAAALVILAGACLILPLGSFVHTGRSTSFQPSGDGTAPVWLIAGPFSDSGDNALFKDYLWWAGGEAGMRARDGALAGWTSKHLVRWQKADTDEDGFIKFSKIWPIQYHSIAYAYTEIQSDSDKYVVATVLGGMNLQVRLNSEIVYENRLLRNEVADKDTLVLHIRKGVNTVLVKAQELVQQFWQMEWKTRTPAGGLFVNTTNTIVPDFVVSQAQAGWGQVEVANASDKNLNNVVLEVLADGLVRAAKSAATSIEAGAVQRIPVWIDPKGPAPDAAPGPMRLRVSSGADQFAFDFTPRVRKMTEFFVKTFRSAVDNSVQPYSVWLPRAFDPAATYPLIVLLHGSTVDAWGQNIFSYSPKQWAIEVAPHDRGDNYYREIGEVDLDEMLAEVAHRYKIDPDGICISGHSMGGYGAWYQATRRPDKYASISAQSATTDESSERPDMLRAGRAQQEAFQKKQLEGWSPITFAENMMYLPVYANHGALDARIPPQQSRQMCARLESFGYKSVYNEVAGQAHWWGSYGGEYGADCVDSPEIDAFLRQHAARVSHPSRVVYVTDSLRYNQAYWVTIDEMDSTGDLARAEASITSANKIDLKLTNITQITLRLDGLVPASEPVTVTINGASAFIGLLPSSLSISLRRESDAGDFQLVGSSSAPAGLYKTHQLFGPVADAFNSPFLFVTGTDKSGSDPETITAVRKCAHALARDWMLRANGIVTIKDDVDVTTADLGSYNLVVFGNVQTNSIIQRMNNDIPIKVLGDGISIRGRLISGAGAVMVAPNPLNPRKYVVVVGGGSAGAFQTAGRLCLADLPDYVVFDEGAFRGKKLTFIAGGFFDKHWRLPD